MKEQYRNNRKANQTLCFGAWMLLDGSGPAILRVERDSSAKHRNGHGESGSRDSI